MKHEFQIIELIIDGVSTFYPQYKAFQSDKWKYFFDTDTDTASKDSDTGNLKPWKLYQYKVCFHSHKEANDFIINHPFYKVEIKVLPIRDTLNNHVSKE